MAAHVTPMLVVSLNTGSLASTQNVLLRLSHARYAANILGQRRHNVKASMAYK